ncbi:hypothetical protein [Faecalicatena contorta]|uniref:hypothetical protein n=1 Tax=Faecalicatena contorta TaxID=39482 RepID=UPI001F3C99D5|nr:hypothetical protein [Faecalicatena contorta]MCF2667982.1 hypothetical protein [Faecalicatena contorta]
MKKKYQFGHVNIEVHMPEGMPIPENMQKFLCESDEVDRIYEIVYTRALNEIEQAFRKACPQAREIRRENLRVLTVPEIECRILNFHGADRPYGIVLEEAGKPIRVWVDEEIRPMLIYDTIFVSLLALEKLMIQQDSLILHSAYMLRDGKAILFSAPSETGKSTQADLWERYRGTRTVNGDRSLLICEKDGWYAYGWPVCGSSEICYNESCPIEAIVMLHQSKTNEIVRIKGFEAVQKLMAQITINMWNAEFQMKAMDLIEEMIGEVPVFELGCDISEEAVRCLEKELEKLN